MKKTELLAPAKDKETALVAIDCGADAIYIGATAFGARKNVPNSLGDIKEIVDYAHKFWVKVCVTMNTILTDDELEQAVKLAKDLENIGVDALIIQDFGLLEKLMNKTKIALHMSTQCDNYLSEKIGFFNKLGASRVVLARECSIDRIKKIHQENPNLELEGFIHGALCVSFSGQCYLSQYIGGRSANRGECAQPCRKMYSVETIDGEVIAKDIHALCLKDFNTSNSIDEMVDAGIYSFKIEGRLKDKNYVKNIVSYYRTLLKNPSSSGKSFIKFKPNPEKSFNRGFTEYFLHQRENCHNFDSPKSKGEFLGKITEVKKDCIKIQTKKELHPQDGIYYNGEGFLVNKVQNGYIYPNKKINAQVGMKVFRNCDFEFEKQLSLSVKRQIGVNVVIENNYIQVCDEDGICIKKELLQGEKANNPEKIKEIYIKQLSKTGEEDFYVKDIKVFMELPFTPVSEINQLRRDLFGELMQKRIEYYNEHIKDIQKLMKYTEYYTDKVDYRANVHNKTAKEFYKKCGCEVIEPSLETKVPARQIALMRTKHCIKYALGICKSPKKLILKDEYGNKYPLKFDCNNCEMSVMKPSK